MSKCLGALTQSHALWWSVLYIYLWLPWLPHVGQLLVSPLAERCILWYGTICWMPLPPPSWDQLSPLERTQHIWACGPLTIPPSGSSREGLLNSQQSYLATLTSHCMHFCLNCRRPQSLREGLEYTDWERLGEGDSHCSYGEAAHLCLV